MFLDKTASKVKGYVNISVCGFFVERFLNLALKEDIKLWNLKRDVDLEVKASVSIFDYKKLVKIAKTFFKRLLFSLCLKALFVSYKKMPMQKLFELIHKP